MKKTTWLLRIVGMLQLVLGLLYLFAPEFMLASMGHSPIAPDIRYPLAMLASRFVAYGLVLLYISADPLRHRLWLLVMVLIQVIDLGAGLFYTLSGVVPPALSGFPMFNAAWIIALLLLWMPRPQNA